MTSKRSDRCTIRKQRLSRIFYGLEVAVSMICEKVFGYSGWTKTRDCRPWPLIASQSLERPAAEPYTGRDLSRHRAREGFQRENRNGNCNYQSRDRSSGEDIRAAIGCTG